MLEAEDGRGRLVQGDNRRALAELANELSEQVTLRVPRPAVPDEAGPRGDRPDRRAPEGPAGAAEGPRRRASPSTIAGRSRAEYLESIGQRLVLIRELLAPHGSVVLHVDPKTSHYVKVLGDEIFGEDVLRERDHLALPALAEQDAEFPARSRRAPPLAQGREDASRASTCPYEPLAASTLATWGTNKQRAVFEKDGRRARSSTTEEATQGVPMGDVWEIGVIAPVSRERTGYPSQKPEALLERLVLALSDEGEVVLDPYAGSGTTLAVAARLGRTFVGHRSERGGARDRHESPDAAGIRFAPGKPLARSA